jgi:hypothetical protein
MKRKLYNSFLLLGILIVAVSCLDWSSQPTEFSTKDILGEWKNDRKQKDSDKDIYHIEYLYFINDSVVDVQLSIQKEHEFSQAAGKSLLQNK